jgi:hypothetical protein
VCISRPCSCPCSCPCPCPCHSVGCVGCADDSTSLSFCSPDIDSLQLWTNLNFLRDNGVVYNPNLADSAVDVSRECVVRSAQCCGTLQ